MARPGGDLRWLGGRTFWLAAFALAMFSMMVLVLRGAGLSRASAVVPVVTLTGPHEAVAGETVRYGLLVRNRTGGPIAGASVRVGFYKTGFVELARAATDDGGSAQVAIAFPPDFKEPRSLIARASAGVAEAEDDIVVQPHALTGGGVFITTDKPLYQPGQTVHIRALAMADDRPLANRAAALDIRIDNTKVFHADLKTSAYGVVATDFDLADQVKLGTYAIHVSVEEGEGRRVSTDKSVEVNRYALPKLKLALEDVSTLSSAASLEGKVHATWIFGEPVTKGAVTVRLVRNGSTERLATGELDRNGVFAFSLPGRSPASALSEPLGSFTLEAALRVPGGLTASASMPLATVEGGEIKLDVFPESGYLVSGVAQTVYVVATGERRAGLTVEARTGSGGPKAKTSAEGIAKLTVLGPTRQEDGTTLPLKLLAYAEDGSEGFAELPPQTALVVRPDRDSYASGSSARVTVLGGNAGDRITLRATHGEEPIATGSCLVERADAGCEVPVTLPAKTAGLVWFQAMSMPLSGQVVVGRRLVLVGGNDCDLRVRATPSKAVFAPRETGAVDVTVTTAGGDGPTKAELGVSAVDEAVFQLAEVRPDLEKSFFTVDKDVRTARGVYNAFWYTKPAGFPTSAAYDPATPEDVRGAILAVLTTMSPSGEIPAASSSAVSARADEVLALANTRLAAWTNVFLALVAIAALIGFAIYGFAFWSSPDAPEVGVDDVVVFKRESRGLVTDWLLGLLAPPLLGAVSVGLTKLFTRSNQGDAVYGAWGALAILCTVLLFRGVSRVRRTAVARAMPTFARVLMFLPPALFFGHLAILLALGDEGRRLGALLPEDTWGVVPLTVVGTAQVASGLLSVVRQTLLRPVTGRGRVWLFLSRSSFLGLPITVLVLVLGTHHVLGELKDRTWASYPNLKWRLYSYSEDYREGGTGVRAKGEDGSMGRPAPANVPRAGGPGGSKASASDLGMVKPRDYFPETLLWAQNIETDASGHASISVPFADSITTWRFGLSAVSAAGQLGSTTIPLVVKQDFFVDAALPAMLTQGDEVSVPVTVYSYLDRDQRVTLELSGDGLVFGGGPSMVDLHPKEARGIRFSLRADKAGERTLTIKARTPGHADATERKVTIVPNGFKVARTANGRVVGHGGATVELPGGAIDGASDLYVKIYGGPLSQVAEGLDGVFQMPHGCFEQTSSITYPSVMVLDFLRRTKATSPELEAKARRVLAEGYQRLLAFEVPGGGFSLFGNAPADVALSAYGLMEFSDMAKVTSVDEQLVARTRDWLYGKRTGSGGWTNAKAKDAKADDVLTTAYVGWALATAGGAEPRLSVVLDRIKGESGAAATEPYALALRANALLAGGRAPDAGPLLDRLATLAVRDEDGVHWTSTAVGVMYSSGASMDVELTGLATHAFALANRDPALRSGALSWIAARRGNAGTWSTTPATVAAMRALLDEAKPAPKEPQDVRVTVDDTPVETVHIEENARDVHRLVSLRPWAKTGKHVLDVQATGSADVSFQLVAIHYLPWQRRPRGAPADLALDVGYSQASVTTGELTTCRVHLAWHGKDDARMPLVEVGIPPAFEVEMEELDRLIAKRDAPVKRVTVERGRLTLYLTDLPPAAPLDIEVPLRATHPARVLAPPSTAYLYYEPEVKVETAPVLLRAM
jgi:hypothetical protein